MINKTDGFTSNYLPRILRYLIILTLFLLFYYHLGTINMNFFHISSETFCAFVSIGIFIIAHNTRRYFTDNSLLLFSVAYLFIGAFDFLHIFSFAQLDYNLAVQFCLCARYIQSISWVLIAQALNWKELRERPIFVIYTLFASLHFGAVLLGIFPTCFIPGHGLTRFVKLSEVVICLMLLSSIAQIIKNRHFYAENDMKRLIWALIATILSRISLGSLPRINFMFTLGHFLQILSYYLIYQAITQAGMKKLFLFVQQSQSELASEKEKLLTTLQSIGDAVIVTDASGLITLANKASEELTGWGQEALQEAFGKICYLIDDETSQPIENPISTALKTGWTCELPKNTVLVTKDGNERLICGIATPVRNMHGHIIGAALAFRDVTLRNRIEEELIKREKLESIEILTGGIAHDFNNMLAGMMANIELTQLMIDKGKDVTGNLLEMKNVIEKASHLTQQLMAFSKEGAPARETTSLRELVQTTVEFTLRGSHTEYELDIADNLWACEVDKVQISQVISNILINASQSMSGGGLVKIQAENVIIEDGEVLPLHPGSYIRISIKDKGPGIPKKLLKKIFDPYFTTKKRGNGLGLATSYSIINKHDGYIEVKSVIGLGTSFNIYLPRSMGNSLVDSPSSSPHRSFLLADNVEH